MSSPMPTSARQDAGIRLIIKREQEEHQRTVSVHIRTLAPWIGLAVVLLLAIIVPSRVWWVLAAGLASALVFSLAWVTEQAVGLRLERRLMYSWTQVGDRLEETFTLINTSSLPVLGVEILDGSDVPGYNASVVRVVLGRSTRTWRVTGVSRQRGVFRLGPTTLHFSDPLGVFRVTCHYSDRRELLVYPPVLPELNITTLLGSGQGSAATHQRTHRDTASTSSVRDYVPGDPIRRIHWKLSMRHRNLLVKQFDRDTGGFVWLLLDTFTHAQAGEGPELTLEYGIVLAASWAWHLLRSGSGVGVFTCGPGQIVTPPAKGMGHVWNVLRMLATVEAQDSLAFDGLLRTFGPYRKRGDAVIAITPSLNPSWVEMLAQSTRQTGGLRAILLDAASFDGQDTASESEALRALLRRQGIPTQFVHRGDMDHARPAVAGSGDWDFFVTGFGKVMVRSRPTRVAT